MKLFLRLINRVYRSHRTSIVGGLLLACGLQLMNAAFPPRYEFWQDILVGALFIGGLTGLGLKDSSRPPQNPPDPPAVR